MISIFQQQTDSTEFKGIFPVPCYAPEPPKHHPRYGECSRLWRYENEQGQVLLCTARFETQDGKAVLPLCYGRNGSNPPRWTWKALPEPRPLYGLPRLAAMPDAPVLLVEGEKTADAAQLLFPDRAVLTWSGGAKVIGKAELSPLQRSGGQGVPGLSSPCESFVSPMRSGESGGGIRKAVGIGQSQPTPCGHALTRSPLRGLAGACRPSTPAKAKRQATP